MLMLSERVKACLSNQRFQESDCIRPDWRLVLVHQATPRLPKINLGSFMRLLILSSVLSISALIRKASAPTPRWRPSWLKLLWCRLWGRVQVSWSIIQRRCWYTGALPGQLSILEVMLKEEKISCFDEILLAVLKFPEPEKKTSNSGSPN